MVPVKELYLLNVTFIIGSTLALLVKTWLSMAQTPFNDGGMLDKNTLATLPVKDKMLVLTL